jgi:hypothetical protein
MNISKGGLNMASNSSPATRLGGIKSQTSYNFQQQQPPVSLKISNSPKDQLLLMGASQGGVPKPAQPRRQQVSLN